MNLFCLWVCWVCEPLWSAGKHQCGQMCSSEQKQQADLTCNLTLLPFPMVPEMPHPAPCFPVEVPNSAWCFYPLQHTLCLGILEQIQRWKYKI